MQLSVNMQTMSYSKSIRKLQGVITLPNKKAVNDNHNKSYNSFMKEIKEDKRNRKKIFLVHGLEQSVKL